MKTSKFLLGLIVFIVISSSANAQTYTIGIKGGLAVPNLTAGGSNSPLSEGYSSRLGAAAGIYVERHFDQTFSLSVGIEYCAQGGKKDGFQALPSSNITGNVPPQYQQMVASFPTYLYADFKNKAKLNYLMLPILARAGWNLGTSSPFRFYVGLGPFWGLLVKATEETTKTGSLYIDKAGTTTALSAVIGALMQQGYSQTQASAIASQLPLESLPSSNTNIISDTHKFNVGILGFVGFSYNFGPNSIFVEGGGNYGFLKIQKSAVNGQNRIGAGVVTIGYGYSL